MDTSRFIFGRNRAEEFPRDVWNRFVVPLFYDQLNFQEQTKALVIEGGRGCGKTTLLNYFCHPTRFSPERVDKLTESDLSYIGLYYRADTNFLSGLQGDSHSAPDFLAAFKHSLAYNIAIEVVESLESINQTDKRLKRLGKLDTLDFEHLGQLFNCDLGRTLSDFKKKLKSLKAQLASWLNNPGQIARPVFLPPQEFVVALIEYIREQLPYLANSSFAVFIDEYENLLDYQKRVINTLLKHGQRPLLYNIAMKRYGFSIRDTTGPEQLQDIHDFTTIDLELYLEKGFDLFAGELLLFKLLEQIPELKDDLPIDPVILRSSEKASIERRRDDAYRKCVLSYAGRVLPRQTERDLAAIVFDDQRLKGRLLENLKKGLARWRSPLAVDRFVRETNPQLTLVASALLARRKEKPESILQDMDAFERHEPSRFTTVAAD